MLTSKKIVLSLSSFGILNYRLGIRISWKCYFLMFYFINDYKTELKRIVLRDFRPQLLVFEAPHVQYRQKRFLNFFVFASIFDYKVSKFACLGNRRLCGHKILGNPPFSYFQTVVYWICKQKGGVIFEKKRALSMLCQIVIGTQF